MHIGRTQSATRWFRFLNLTLLLAFLPMGVLGSRFHSLLHRHSCASHDSSQHVLAADLLAWFDAGNRSLDDLLLGLERSWQTPSHAEACEARGTEAIHNGEITFNYTNAPLAFEVLDGLPKSVLSARHRVTTKTGMLYWTIFL